MGSTRIDVGQLATACQDLQLFCSCGETLRTFSGKLSLGMKSRCFTSVAGASTSGWIATNSQNQSLRGDLHQNKIMSSIWWDYQNVLYYKLLPTDTTITLEVYC